MHKVSELVRERWVADMRSSGQGRRTVTRLRADGEELVNALEWLEMGDDEFPTQLIVCAECGYPGCDLGGYAHVSRLGGGHVLVSPPRVEAGATGPGGADVDAPLPALKRQGSLLIPIDLWNASGLPVAQSLPSATPMDVALAWMSEVVAQGELRDLDQALASIERRCIASDRVEKDQAVTRAGGLARRLAGASGGLGFEVVDLSALDRAPTTLYLHRPGAAWMYVETAGDTHPAFAIGYAVVSSERS